MYCNYFNQSYIQQILPCSPLKVADKILYTVTPICVKLFLMALPDELYNSVVLALCFKINTT